MHEHLSIKSSFVGCWGNTSTSAVTIITGACGASEGVLSACLLYIYPTPKPIVRSSIVILSFIDYFWVFNHFVISARIRPTNPITHTGNSISPILLLMKATTTAETIVPTLHANDINLFFKIALFSNVIIL